MIPLGAPPDRGPSWFGFPTTVRAEAGIARDAVTGCRGSRGVRTRVLFGGDLTRQPAYATVLFRTIGDLRVADRIMRDRSWVGVVSGPDHQRLDHVVVQIVEATRSGGAGAHVRPDQAARAKATTRPRT
jgi:CDP-4-dehydro-6-deoxyglucose reductase, E1